MPNCELWDSLPGDCEWLAREYSRPRWDKKVEYVLLENWDMPIATAGVCLVAESDESLEERFREQAEKWDRETEHLSSPTQMMMHPSYQAILGMASESVQDVVRLMLRDLRDNRRLWFWALSYLTKDNPIKPADAGKLDRMTQAWVEWGERRGMI